MAECFILRNGGSWSDNDRSDILVNGMVFVSFAAIDDVKTNGTEVQEVNE